MNRYDIQLGKSPLADVKTCIGDFYMGVDLAYSQKNFTSITVAHRFENSYGAEICIDSYESYNGGSVRFVCNRITDLVKEFAIKEILVDASDRAILQTALAFPVSYVLVRENKNFLIEHTRAFYKEINFGPFTIDLEDDSLNRLIYYFKKKAFQEEDQKQIYSFKENIENHSVGMLL
jgi:hypothetical protein